MPALHAHLRGGIAYEPLEPDPGDLLEPTPEIGDSYLRAAKRRRIESIAKRYLGGKCPFVLSATLRGPFDTNWTNPWRTIPLQVEVALEEPQSQSNTSHAPVETSNQQEKEQIPEQKEAHWLKRVAMLDHSQLSKGNVSTPTPITAAHRTRNKRPEQRSHHNQRNRFTPPVHESVARDITHQYVTPGMITKAPVDPPSHIPQEESNMSEQSTTPEVTLIGDAETGAFQDPLEEPNDGLVESAVDQPVPYLPNFTTEAMMEIISASARRHKHIASPAPLSSSGFQYRKIKRRTDETAVAKEQKVLPTPKRSSPSPAPGEDKSIPADTVSVERVNGDESGTRSDHQDDHEPEPTTASNQSQGDRNEDLRASRLSNFSTQAAMALACFEFQGGSSFIPEVDTGPDEGGEEATVMENLGGDATITTFHQINEELSRPESFIHSPDYVQMSTQDLFGAASPFAFSTVKKKRRESTLRFAIGGEKEHDVPADKDAKGPPRSDGTELQLSSPEKKMPVMASGGIRKPLQDKNGRGGLMKPAKLRPRVSGQHLLVDSSPMAKQKEAAFEMSNLDVDLSMELESVDQFLHSVGGLSCKDL